MDIHIVVEKPEYMILSEQAAALELQIGHYCTRLLRAHLADNRDETQELVALRELVGIHEITIGALRTDLEAANVLLRGDSVEPKVEEEDLQPETGEKKE